MDPVTMALGASAAVGAIGKLVTGANQATSLGQQASTDLYNAQMGFKEAQTERAQGSEQEQQIRSAAERQLGVAFASAGQSGTRGGTTAGAVRDVAVQGELDAENAAYNADEKARATYIKGQQAEYAGKIASAQIPGVQIGSYIGAAAELAGGAGKIAGSKSWGDGGTTGGGTTGDALMGGGSGAVMPVLD